jgi:GT2 family glycosyltransferase
LGKYILVLDDDSHPVDAACLDRITELLDSDMKVGAVACRIESASGKRVMEWHLPDTDEYGPSPAFIGCGFAIRKNLFERIGFFPSDFFLYQNEIEVAIRLRLEGYETVFDPSCRVVHRFVPSGRTNARRVFYPTRNSLWLIRKYYDFPLSLYLIFCRIIFGFIRAVEGREFRTYFRAVSEGLNKDVRKMVLKGRERGFASVLLKQNSILNYLLRLKKA